MSQRVSKQPVQATTTSTTTAAASDGNDSVIRSLEGKYYTSPEIFAAARSRLLPRTSLVSV